MLSQNARLATLPDTGCWLERPMSWLRPGGTRDGREAYQLRFLTGALLLATVISLLAIVAAVALGFWRGAAVTGAYLALILLQALAVRLGAPVRVLAWTIIATVGLYLVAAAVLPSANQSGQLYWFLLIPLAARALAAPRHDAAAAVPSWRSEFISGCTALVAVVLVVAYVSARSTPAPVVPPAVSYAVGLDVALFMVSALGLLHVHDLSVRRTAAELHRLQALLSVCAWCRKIRDGGEWVGLEQYLSQRQNIELTHGMCPACYENQSTSGRSAPAP